MTGSSVLFDAPGPRARRISLIASIVGGALIIGILAWVVWTLAQPRISGGVKVAPILDASRWDIFTDPVVWQTIGDGVAGTLKAAAVAALFAIVLGVVFSLLRSSENAWVRVPTAWVLEFLRGMPVLLMMLFILLVASTGSFWAVVIALALYNGTLIGEALRAGLAALPRGQREAALSLGMRSLQAKLLVEFPQAFRQMLPIIVAQLVVLLKDTSLGYIVAYDELVRVMMNRLASYFGNKYLFSLFFVCLAIYLAINLSLSWFARWLARRTASGGRRGGGRGAAAQRAADATANPTQAMLAVKASADAQSAESQAPPG